MVFKSISFGQTYTAGEKTVMGLGYTDAENIFKQSETNQQKKIKDIEDQISFSEEAISIYGLTFRGALETLRDKLSAIASNSFAAIDPITNAKVTNVFDHKKITAETNNTKEAEYYCSIAYTGGGSGITYAQEVYDFQILQLATEHSLQTIKFNSSTANVTQENGASNSGLFNCGTFQLNNANLTINSGDSLTAIKQNINALNANAQAYLRKINTQYRLEIRSTIEGTAGAINITDPNNVLNGVFGNLTSPTAENVRTFAQDAQLCFLGSTDVYTFGSNTITEFIDDFTVKLHHPTDGDVIHLEVNQDTDEAFHSIISFTEAYNDFIDFVGSQQRREKTQKRNEHGEVSEYIKAAEGSYLYKNQIMLDVFNRINAELGSYSSVQSINGETFMSIGGISPAKITQADVKETLNPFLRYKINVDPLALANYLEDELATAKNILVSTAEINSTNFEIATSGPFFGIGNFTVSVNLTDSLNATSYLSKYDEISGSMQQIPLNVLLFNQSNALEGGIVNYVGDDDYFSKLNLLYSGNQLVDYAKFDTNYGLAEYLIDIIDDVLAEDSVIDQGEFDLNRKLEKLLTKKDKATVDLDKLQLKKLKSLQKEQRMQKANMESYKLTLSQDAMYAKK